MESTFVLVHDCLKNNSIVVIKATVVESRHGSITSLTAHDENCKKVK